MQDCRMLPGPARHRVSASAQAVRCHGRWIALAILLALSACSSDDEGSRSADQESAQPTAALREAAVARPNDKHAQASVSPQQPASSVSLNVVHFADLPEAYGLYAMENGQLQRLDGDATWERDSWPRRADFSPAVRFIIFDRGLSASLAAAPGAVRLGSVAAVRNEVQWSTGGVQPVAKKYEWVAPQMASLDTPLDVRPVPDHPDMFFVEPLRPLSPGLYELSLRNYGAGSKARLGVQWSKTSRDEYAQTHCVDRVMGSEVSYAECGAAPSAAITAPGAGG